MGEVGLLSALGGGGGAAFNRGLGTLGAGGMAAIAL